MAKKQDPLVGKTVEYDGEEYAVTRVGDGPKGTFVWLVDHLGAPYTLYPADVAELKVTGKAVSR